MVHAVFSYLNRKYNQMRQRRLHLRIIKLKELPIATSCNVEMQILCASYHSFPITMDKAKSKDSHCLDGIASGLFVCNRGDTEQYM